MIDINSWPLNLQIAFGIAPFLISMAGVALGAYIACSRDFNTMLAALQSSLWLEQQMPFWGTKSLVSRCYLVNTVCAAMVFPRIGIQRGLFDADELRVFPASLKYRMIASFWLTVIGAVWVLIGLGLYELSEGKN
ncbi:hypothetical protein KC131_13695 [Pseudomonas sp. JQ170]|uniref:hypothetical protein n=1 Tax=unclassified Pseudomonas TaxID=196821 RepID=UPI0026561B4C|nr:MULTISPECIES: hypothetical protein [unclassified Pseudomonas]MDN7141695.1 hypothetical protein [Pseudomonas sp. JQ170]WRO75352.1 hypothetical protein U9R80_23150 [Pseudomonas sp. 170C]